MFNALPFIAKSLKQDQVRDLKVAAFLAISQICCRQTLSVEYTQAFVRQILQTVASTDLSDPDVKLKGLTVLLFLAMYQKQSLQEFKRKDFQLLAGIPRLSKILQSLSEKYDTSPLAKLVTLTALNDQDLALEQVLPILKSLMHGQLKTTFLQVQTLAFEGIKEDIQGRSDRARQLLREIKGL